MRQCKPDSFSCAIVDEYHDGLVHMNTGFFLLSLISAVALACSIDVMLMRKRRPKLGFFLGLVLFYPLLYVNLFVLELQLPRYPDPRSLSIGEDLQRNLFINTISGAFIALLVIYPFVALLLTRFYLVLDKEVVLIHTRLCKFVIPIGLIGTIPLTLPIMKKIDFIFNLPFIGHLLVWSVVVILFVILAMALAPEALMELMRIMVWILSARPHESLAIVGVCIIGIFAIIGFRRGRARTSHSTKPKTKLFRSVAKYIGWACIVIFLALVFFGYVISLG